ncbi:outer dense fiber protein 3 [Trichonephila clavipes]|nr:outer dense fiber protein 3 [Trichonephila clavipes]
MRGTLTGQRYVDDILRPHVGPFLNGFQGAIFQQDNARPHTARVAQDFLRHCQTLPLPARSPDLSPVEHSPGAYSPEKTEKTLNHAPSYTFGSKYKDPKLDDVPAPNSYNIPETIGGYDNVHYQAPKYTMGGKEGDIWTTNKNPGPGSYNVTETDKLKQKAPAYSISQKTNIPTDKSKKPGPGAHSPEKVVMQHSPSFSFGIRHSPFSHQYQKRATARNTEESVECNGTQSSSEGRTATQPSSKGSTAVQSSSGGSTAIQSASNGSTAVQSSSGGHTVTQSSSGGRSVTQSSSGGRSVTQSSSSSGGHTVTQSSEGRTVTQSSSQVRTVTQTVVTQEC